jgi:hypothetical protein
MIMIRFDRLEGKKVDHIDASAGGTAACNTQILEIMNFE